MPVTYDSIASITVSSATPSINMLNIPSTFSNLKLIITCFYTSGGNGLLQVRFNDSGATAYGSLTAFTANNGTNRSNFNNQNWMNVDGNAPTGTGNQPAIYEMDIVGHNQSNQKTVLLCKGGGANFNTFFSTNEWTNNSIVTQINFQSLNASFDVGTKISLYGIQGA